MSLIYCPYCKKLIFDSDENCPNCGYSIHIQNKKSAGNGNVFGAIALVLSILSLLLPRLLIALPILLGFIFSFIGLSRDSRKSYSVIALVLLISFGLFDLYNEANQQLAEEYSYSVKYVVEGEDFSVSFTNETGDLSNEDGRGRWTKTITLKGGDHAYVTAQNQKSSGEISVEVYVNNELMDSGYSTGEYSIATASCRPKDIKGKY
jgi:hypothetical protein